MGTILNEQKMVDGKLATHSVNHLIDISRGVCFGYTPMWVLGYNGDVGATDETLWPLGGLYTYSTSPVTMYISSSNTADTQPYEVEGLDANWQPQTVSVTAQGQNKTEIGSGVTWSRIFNAQTLSGSNNAGNVYIYEDDTVTGGVPNTVTKIRGYIATGLNHAQQALWTVPAKCTAYVFRWQGAAVNNKPSGMSANYRPAGGVFRRIDTFVLQNSAFTQSILMPVPFSEKSDLELRASAVGGSGIASGGFYCWYEEN